MLDELTEALAEKSLTLRYTDEAAALIAERSYSAKFGARNMRRYIQRHVEDAIAEAVIADYTHELTRILVHTQDGEIKVSCM
jgi:ATP-dependent Clp protease ATP-binding subunit ClpA